MAQPQTVAQILAAIVDADGAGFRVGPTYFPNIDDAERARLGLARRLARVSETLRDEYLVKMRMHQRDERCAYCMCVFQSLAQASIVGAALLHTSCAREWAAFLDKAEREARYALTPAGKAMLGRGVA